MSENVVLYGPNGASPINIGSWLQADPGPDYGARGLLQAIEAESFSDGGQFVYERAGIRHMQLPLMPASGGAGLSLSQLESLIRLNAKPGAYIDVQPDGVPSAEAVRFDILHGRWEPAHSIPINRAARRPGMLYLDTQPYGYWPTWIALASVASAPLAPHLAVKIPAASVIGDAPAHVRLRSTPVLISVSGGVRGYPDFAAWALGKPSTGGTFKGWAGQGGGGDFAAAAFGAQGAAVSTVAASDGTASFIGGKSARFWSWNANGVGSYQDILDYTVDPAGRGRYRLFAWARLGMPSQVSATLFPLNLAADVAWKTTDAMASAGPIATVVPVSSTNPYVSGTTTNLMASYYGMYDLGDIELPPREAGAYTNPANCFIRLWGYFIWNASTASSVLDIAGISLLPLEQSGYVPRGLAQPSINAALAANVPILDGSLQIDTASQLVALSNATINNTSPPRGGLAGYYLGGMPRLYPGSDAYLTLMLEDRLYNTNNNGGLFNYASGLESGPPMRGGDYAIGYSFAYRPSFQFLKGL